MATRVYQVPDVRKDNLFYFSKSYYCYSVKSMLWNYIKPEQNKRTSI